MAEKAILEMITNVRLLLDNPEYLDKTKSHKVLIPDWVVKKLRSISEGNDPLLREKALRALQKIEEKVTSDQRIEIDDPERDKKIVSNFMIVLPFAVIALLLGIFVHLAFLPFGIIGLIIVAVVKHCHGGLDIARKRRPMGSETWKPSKSCETGVDSAIEDPYGALITEPASRHVWYTAMARPREED